MKKVILLLLVTAYSLSTLGITVSSFYCCGNLKSISVNFIIKDQGDCQDKKCCNTHHELHKVDSQHLLADPVIFPVYFNVSPVQYYDSYTFSEKAIRGFNFYNQPNLHQDIPVYLIHCSFLI